MSAISKTIELAEESSPIYKEAETYTLLLERCLEGFCCANLSAILQMALPMFVMKEKLQMAQSNQKINYFQQVQILPSLPSTICSGSGNTLNYAQSNAKEK
eukprot:2443086-Ditylum_brightwellii.AAC.1